MTTTLPKKIEQQIIARLEDGHNRDDIILDLCESQGLSWNQAEAILDSIHAENADNITLMQSPVLVVIAMGTFIGGAGLLVFATFHIMQAFNYFQTISTERANVLASFFVYLLSYSSYLFWLFGIGIAMIIGSMRGMTDVWAAILSKVGFFQAD